MELGQEQIIHLNLFSEKTREAVCYVDHPLLAEMSVGIKKQGFILLEEGQTNSIDISVRSLRLQPQKFVINCVEKGTRKLLGVWCVRVLTSPPVIDRVIKVDPVKVNTKHVFTFEYRNQT